MSPLDSNDSNVRGKRKNPGPPLVPDSPPQAQGIQLLYLCKLRKKLCNPRPENENMPSSLFKNCPAKSEIEFSVF